MDKLKKGHEAMTLSDRQVTMLDVLARSSYAPLGLLELVDEDFLDLLKQGLIDMYTGAGCSMRCHITVAGMAELQKRREEG